MSDPHPIRVEVPVCAFRPYASREYQDTYPVPPPATVYGMLLSLLGIPREEKAVHRGAEMALAVKRLPMQRSRVFRKLRRGKDLDETRPDYQDLLIDLKLWIWLADGRDQASPKLPKRVADAIRSPEMIDRFGGLSLGESSYLVDSITISHQEPNAKLYFLKPDKAGFYNLPVWVDHAENRNIRWRFNIEQMPVADALEKCRVYIGEEQSGS